MSDDPLSVCCRHLANSQHIIEAKDDEIARLKSRLRFCDAVIRSGDVAALTDAEREAVEQAIAYMAGTVRQQAIDALRGLLNRLTQQHSQLP